MDRVQMWLIWFYAVLFGFDSMMMISCRPEHWGMFSVIILAWKEKQTWWTTYS